MQMLWIPGGYGQECQFWYEFKQKGVVPAHILPIVIYTLTSYDLYGPFETRKKYQFLWNSWEVSTLKRLDSQDHSKDIIFMLQENPGITMLEA